MYERALLLQQLLLFHAHSERGCRAASVACGGVMPRCGALVSVALLLLAAHLVPPPQESVYLKATSISLTEGDPLARAGPLLTCTRCSGRCLDREPFIRAVCLPFHLACFACSTCTFLFCRDVYSKEEGEADAHEWGTEAQTKAREVRPTSRVSFAHVAPTTGRAPSSTDLCSSVGKQPRASEAHAGSKQAAKTPRAPSDTWWAAEQSLTDHSGRTARLCQGNLTPGGSRTCRRTAPPPPARTPPRPPAPPAPRPSRAPPCSTRPPATRTALPPPASRRSRRRAPPPPPACDAKYPLFHHSTTLRCARC